MPDKNNLIAQFQAELAAKTSDERNTALANLHSYILSEVQQRPSTNDDFQSSVTMRLDSIDSKLASIERTVAGIAKRPRPTGDNP